MKEKILWGIAVVGLFLGVVAVVNNPRASGIFGAAGNMLAENYIPYVQYNGGYKSAKDVETTATLTVGGASTLTGDVTLSGGNGALTLTTSNSATSTATVGCYQTYATSTATAVRITFGTNAWATSTTQGSNANGLVAWQYGSCPI